MATRIYIANEEAHDVSLKQVCKIPDIHTAAVVGVGAWLVYRGLKAGGIISTALTVGGAALLAKQLTGKSLGDLLNMGKLDSTTHANAPSYADNGRIATQEPEDMINEAAMESFPASDPPASHRSTQLPPT